ncbi:DUF2963 domain-containing protein [Candidatus Phytoplasma meliae]|uniref:DUF2963 domain-containing protein n=1 Tax=Candidatus Phytoplasma meliae TaxID=1848402 RepID=A0ABS5CXY2_9MOLU|nr:DUF2963 domain-containing protein [Candidatus Phytoplasma meliae]MBP5835831.1 DUF2963 domain-containing protein [Candidatus Phytoplasma meliae]
MKNNEIKTTYYPKTIKSNQEIDSQTGKIIKETNFNEDGTLNNIIEFHPKKGNKIKKTVFLEDVEDEKIIDYIEEYDSQQKVIKITYYNGEYLHFIEKFEPKTGNLIKTTFYNLDTDEIDYIKEYDRNENITKETYYNKDGTIKFIYEYDQDGNITKEISCTNDDK